MENIHPGSGLSDYHSAAVENLSTGPVPICIGIYDAALENTMRDWYHPSPLRALKMFQFSWSSLRASVLSTRIGTSSHVAPVQRQALEAIAYGFLFLENEECHELWKRRHDDVESKKKFRGKGWAEAIKAVESHDVQLAKRIRRLYDVLIDFGAHPNPLALELFSDFQFSEGDHEGVVNFNFLNGEPALSFAYIDSATVFDLLTTSVQLVWPDRSRETNLIEKRDQARGALMDFVNDTKQRA